MSGSVFSHAIRLSFILPLISFHDYEMDCECQRFLPFRSRRHRVFGTTVNHYVKFARVFQPVPEVQGGNAAVSDDFEVSVVVAPRDDVIHFLAL